MKTKKVFQVPHQKPTARGEIRERILLAAREEFLRLGFSGVTTDRIAASLGISKATLYRFFASKEQLCREVLLGLLQEVEAGVDALIKNPKLEFAEKLAGILSFMGLELAKMSGLFSLDLQRNAPRIWKEVEAFRQENILSKLKLILSQGLKSGDFRNDMDQDFLILLYVTVIQEIMNPAILVKFSLSFPEAFRMIVSLMIEGILTEKGRARYHTASRRPSEKGLRRSK
jgi:AcrR family transcriptional regulator